MASILTAVRELSDDRSAPVPARAIADRVGLPVKTVTYHLASMERLGLVRRHRRDRSGIEGWSLTGFQLP